MKKVLKPTSKLSFPKSPTSEKNFPLISNRPKISGELNKTIWLFPREDNPNYQKISQTQNNYFNKIEFKVNLMIAVSTPEDLQEPEKFRP